MQRQRSGMMRRNRTAPSCTMNANKHDRRLFKPGPGLAVALLACALLLAGLTGCGQKGDLYLPEEEPEAQLDEAEES